jgi:hypothetical protein
MAEKTPFNKKAQSAKRVRKIALVSRLRMPGRYPASVPRTVSLKTQIRMGS